MDKGASRVRGDIIKPINYYQCLIFFMIIGIIVTLPLAVLLSKRPTILYDQEENNIESDVPKFYGVMNGTPFFQLQVSDKCSSCEYMDFLRDMEESYPHILLNR